MIKIKRKPRWTPIVAISWKDCELHYDTQSSHRVSKRNAEKIVKLLNEEKYNLKTEREIWRLYKLHDKYCATYDVGQEHRFILFCNKVVEIDLD